MKLKIDGVEVDIVRLAPCSDGSYWRNVYVKPKGAEGGAHSCHTVPALEGSFRTNGRLYEFEP